jgi:hypothetical protein
VMHGLLGLWRRVSAQVRTDGHPPPTYICEVGASLTHQRSSRILNSILYASGHLHTAVGGVSVSSVQIDTTSLFKSCSVACSLPACSA